MIESVFIFRRDLRIYDNIGLFNSIKESDIVYPIFIFTPEQIDNNDYKSDNAVQFMIESLKELKKKLPELTFFHGNYMDVLKNIIKKKKINKIFCNKDYTNYSTKRDKDIEKLCIDNKIEFCHNDDLLLYTPGNILNKSGEIYQKFTPFYNECLKHKISNSLLKINSSHMDKFKKIKNVDLSINKSKMDDFYKHNENINVNGGRINGLKVLKILENFKDYDTSRNDMSKVTTHLSAYIKFGCLSIREVFLKLRKLFGLNDPLIRQLIWREFYYHLGYGFPDRFGKALKPKYDNIKWRKNTKHLNAWKKGETGFPIVDACMKQINTTGYMHNRGRLIVASFLVKNLGIDWREGEKYFAQSLVDYDVLVNNGNWQWVSGSGADSQQYIRVFNPSLQAEKFDKEAKYIKKWLSNLSEIPNKELFYWQDYHNNYNLKDINYVKPIIDYKESKKEVMEIYKKGLY